MQTSIAWHHRSWVSKQASFWEKHEDAVADHHQSTKFGNEGNEGKRIKSWGKSLENEAVMRKLNFDDIEDFSALEFMHRLSISRSRKPLL
ncbi:hypothetical protein ACFX13_047941 [Malus domestica]